VPDIGVAEVVGVGTMDGEEVITDQDGDDGVGEVPIGASVLMSADRPLLSEIDIKISLITEVIHGGK
jgi:hypothetical protein